MISAQVVGVGNTASTPDGDRSGGGFANINGAVTTMRGVQFADNAAEGMGSAVGFRYHVRSGSLSSAPRRSSLESASTRAEEELP